MQQIRDFYYNVLQFHEKEILDFAVSNSRLVTIPGKHYLFRIGDPITELYFYNSGFFIASKPLTASRKNVEFISFERGAAVLSANEPIEHICQHDVYVTVESTFVVISFKDIQEILRRSEEARRANLKILQASVNHYLWLKHARSLPLIERVLSFFERYPHCGCYMVNADIAVLLNMSRQEYVKTLKQISNV